MTKTPRWAEVLAIVAILAVLTAFLWPISGHGPTAEGMKCLSNLKKASVGLIVYANDENDRYPPRDFWMDATYPYTKSDSIWHCPTLSKDAYGYAMNGVLSSIRQSTLGDPVRTPLLYDSVNPTRNASDLCTSLPLPGRHERKKGNSDVGKNTVAFADGHAKLVPGMPVGGGVDRTVVK